MMKIWKIMTNFFTFVKFLLFSCSKGIRKVRYYSLSLIRLVANYMSNSKQAEFLTEKENANKINEEDLINALKEVKATNDRIRESFKYDRKALSVRAGRYTSNGI